MAYKKIEGIKPFNEMHLRSCYYNQLVAAYTAFGLNPKFIAGNYLPLYSFDSENNILSINCCEIFNEKELCKITGIKIIKFEKTDNLEKFVIKQINNQRPVIVFVDSFYLDYRDDTYKDQHISHALLIYGYDTTNKIYIVNEHMYMNSYQYIEKKVSMEMLAQAYENFVSGLMVSKYSLFCFSKKNQMQENGVETIRVGLLNRRKELIKSKNHFKKGIDHLKICLNDRKKLIEQQDSILSFLGAAKMYKNTQRNLLGYLFGEEGIYKTADRVMENYTFINALLFKMKVTECYNDAAIKKIISRFDELELLESELHEWLIQGGGRIN